MSWTNSTTVKKHLFDLDKLTVNYADVKTKFGATGVAELPHKGLVSGSGKVKALASFEPVSDSGITLNGETWSDLTYENLQPDEIVLAVDEGLDTVYQLDKDYAVDFENGKVRRIDGGSIGDGSVVAVYYMRYSVKVKDTDYTIDYDNGQVSVKAGGSLEPDTDVWVDYQLSAASGADQLIDEAITEVEDKILANLKDEYDASSTEQGLKTGAVELTMAVVCRGLASRALSDGKTSAEGRARGWRDLSVQYELAAWRSLRPFLKSPQIAAGSKKGNQSWEWS
ncbi:MAG: hypothetical protein HQ568_11035 [Calditrichaeota bacterium]|nr:hypothetical protein [Calditrichota bacterium]